MTEERLALSELLEKAGEGDFLRAVAEAVLQLLMEADVEGLIGAGRYERGGSARPGAMATVTVRSTRVWEVSSCGSRSCGRAATSHRSWRRGKSRRRR
jgi:transposase-like protein